MEGYKKFNFVHIPKCGGTSFRHLLNLTAQQNEILQEDRYIVGLNGIANDKHITQLNKEELSDLSYSSIKVIAGHHKYREIEDHLEIEHTKNIFHYTILRNPIDRFISHYNFFHYKLNYHNCQGIKLTELEPRRLDKYIKLYANLHIRYLANLKYPKLFDYENQFKVAWFNLLHEFSCYGILELSEKSKEILRQKSPVWFTFYDEMKQTNSNKVEYELSDEIINQIRTHNLLDIRLYNLAKDHMLQNM